MLLPLRLCCCLLDHQIDLRTAPTSPDRADCIIAPAPGRTRPGPAASESRHVKIVGQMRNGALGACVMTLPVVRCGMLTTVYCPES
jgi:hypothetical protein